jgi:predicted TIM-barrel fold metal-dependent hydrolase
MKIDAFNHFSPASYLEEVYRLHPTHPAATLFRNVPELWDVEARLRLLDEFDDYAQVLSLGNPPLETLGPPTETPRLAQLANDTLAATCRVRPDRFLGFVASLPMNNPEASVIEARRAVRELGARGVQLFTNVLGKPLSAPEFFPVLATMAELDLPVLVHPMRLANHPDYATEKESEAEIWFTFGWPYETSACMTRLIFAGVFDKLPTLKILTHHMGGMIPYFADKIALGFSQIFFGSVDHNPLVDKLSLKQEPLAYFRMLYGDTATNGSVSAMLCGHAFFGGDRALFATDAPFDPRGGRHLIGRTIAAVEALPIAQGEKLQIFEGNVRKLMGL